MRKGNYPIVTKREFLKGGTATTTRVQGAYRIIALRKATSEVTNSIDNSMHLR
jgi:hypothetical protein